MGLIVGLIAAIILFTVFIGIGGLLLTLFGWIFLGILAVICFIFFRFMFKWLIVILLVVGIYKLLKGFLVR